MSQTAERAGRALLAVGGLLRRAEVSGDGRTLHQIGGREADSFYRDRWSYDKVVRSTHGVNCTGSCSCKVYVAPPLLHDTPDALASPGGVVRDWKTGEVPAVPGATMPKFIVVERDYRAIAAKMAALGPLLGRRFHPVPVLVWCFTGTALFAVIQAFQPPLIPVATTAFLGMAALLGAASGAVSALVGKVAPADKVGSVTGVATEAAGGLGGFVPPLIMGWGSGSKAPTPSVSCCCPTSPWPPPSTPRSG